MTGKKSCFIDVYRRKNIDIVRAEGSYIYSKEKKYLDMISGLGVNVLGSSDKDVIKSIENQIKKYMHVSNFYQTAPAVEMAEFLVERTFGEKVFFCNSGTESIEAGMKLIKKYGRMNGKKNIIAFSKGFHGRSLGSISVTHGDNLRSRIEPLIPGIISIPFDDISEAEKHINEDTSGVILEVIQGQGGINIASDEFILKVRELCDRFGAVLFIDEIQSGMGRTGKLFAFEHYGIEPDLAAMAKAVGGGLPLGVLVSGKRYCDVLEKGDHGSTFGGNPVACAAGLTTLKKISDDSFLKSVDDKGFYLIRELKELETKYPEILSEPHGKGLMIGIRLLKDSGEITQIFQDKGVIVNVTGGNILRLLPPLNISYEEIDLFLDIFRKVLEQFRSYPENTDNV